MGSLRNRPARTVLVAALIFGFCPATHAIEFAGGAGEPNDPYQIATSKQLIALGSDPNLWGKHFALVHDLDMAGVDPNIMGPIGDHKKPFVGVFDGRGHTISNLRMERKVEMWLGLFGCVGENLNARPKGNRAVGHIRNLRLKDVNVQAEASGGGLVGLFAGATIKNCSVSGVVRGGGPMCGTGGLIGWLEEGQVTSCSANVDVRGEAEVGGLIGEMVGADVMYCSSSGRVQGGTRMGGLIGIAQFWDFPVGVHADRPQEKTNPGSIRCCRSDCSVIDGETAGGLVGYVLGTGKVEDCYALGPVFGKQAAGGLVGESGGSCIVRCYSAGRVMAKESTGGFIGNGEYPMDANTPPGYPPCQLVVEKVSPTDLPNGESTRGPQWRVIYRPAVLSCFWDAEASQVARGMGSGTDARGGINPLTTAKMRTAEAFRNFGWDFENVWTISEGKDYPRLRWEGVACGE